LASTRVMASLLYEVKVRDLATFVFAPVVFLLIGIVASYVPARRAMSVDPVEALRGIR
jgi:putative ABC transport system permease protein